MDEQQDNWFAGHLTFDDAEEYLRALEQNLRRSRLVDFAPATGALSRFMKSSAWAVRQARREVAEGMGADREVERVWHYAAGDGRADLACALMDHCEAAGHHNGAPE